MAEMTDAPVPGDAPSGTPPGIPPAPPSGTPPGKPAGRPRGKQLLILLGGGFVLALGGCALFLANLNINENGGGTNVLSALGGIIFAGGSLMFVIGLIIAFVLGLQKILDRQKR